MDWRRLLRLPVRKAPAVKEAEQVQDEQFREWANVMREVERVQKIADHPRRRAPHV